MAFSNGNPDSLIYGTDYLGQVCGSTNKAVTVNGLSVGGADFTNKKLIAYPRLTFDILHSTLYGGFDPKNPTGTITSLTLTGICTSVCPVAGQWVCLYEAESALARITGNNGLVPEPARTKQITKCQSSPTSDCTIVNTNCYKLSLNTTASFNKCIPSSQVLTNIQVTCIDPGPLPDDKMSSCVTAKQTVVSQTLQPGQSDYLYDKFNSPRSTLHKQFEDLYKTALPTILIGILFSIFFAFVLIVALHFATFLAVWIIIIVTVLLVLIVTIVLYSKAGVISSTLLTSTLSLVAQNGTAVQVPSYLSTSVSALSSYYTVVANMFLALTIALVLILTYLRSRVYIAIDIMVEASRCIDAIPLTLVYPFFTCLLIFLLALWFSSVGLYLASATDLTLLDQIANFTQSPAEQQLLQSLATSVQTNLNYSVSLSALNSVHIDTSYSALYNYLAIYHIFGFLWMNSFIQAIGMTTIAGAVSTYYFMGNKDGIMLYMYPTFISNQVYLYNVYIQWYRS